MRFVLRPCVVAGLVFLATGVSNAETLTASGPAAARDVMSATAPAAALDTSLVAAEPASDVEVLEPQKWMLLLAGLGAVGWVARRRR